MLMNCVITVKRCGILFSDELCVEDWYIQWVTLTKMAN